MAARRQRGRRAALRGAGWVCVRGWRSEQQSAEWGTRWRREAAGRTRDGRGGQRSGTRMIFFWRSESHVMGRGSGMTTAVSGVRRA
jgi:hypothetical protein